MLKLNIFCVTLLFIVLSGGCYCYHHHFTEEEAGSKRLKNLPKNTNTVTGGEASSQIQVSPIRERSYEIFHGKLYNRKFLSLDRRILVSKAFME